MVTKLPRYVAFKGDNGKYLSAVTVEGHPYLMFEADDIGDPTVGNQIFTTDDGHIRIKSIHFNRFWRRSPNWIWADTDDTNADNRDTLFEPVKVGDNVVALRNLGNNYFCKRLTTEGKTSCLNAGISTISREARMELSDLVISRKIYNLRYRLNDAKVYDKNILTLVTGSIVNSTDQLGNFTIPLEYTETRTNTWETSLSFTLGVTFKIEAGVPLIESQSIEISTEFKAEYKWGETITREIKMAPVYQQPVKPKTKVTVSLVATQGTCDVPFSYTQRDILMDGSEAIYEMNDGLYTGINCYNFNYEAREEKLN